MKKDPLNTPESQRKSNAQNAQKAPGIELEGKAPEVKKTGAADKVEISSRSKMIADIISAVNRLPDIREGKVQKIKQSIDAGTYTVDPQRVAEKILKEIYREGFSPSRVCKPDCRY